MKKYLSLVVIMSSCVFGAEEDPHFTRVAQAIGAVRISDERKETGIERYRAISNILNDALITIADIIANDPSCSGDDFDKFHQAVKNAQISLMDDKEYVLRTINLINKFFADEARVIPSLRPYVDHLEAHEQKLFQGLPPEVYRARIEQQNQFNDAITRECKQEMGLPLQRAINAIHHRSFFIKWDSDTESDEMV